MKTSIWYHTADRQPDKDGHYLAYRGWGMGGKADGDCDHGYLYYRVKDGKWYEYEGAWRSSFPDEVSFVYYWTDADPVGWVENDVPVAYRKKAKANPALEIAWKNVERAVEQYEMIRALVGENAHDD